MSKPGPWLREAFGPSETSLTSDGEPRELLALWSAKEAAAKALGQGLQGGAGRVSGDRLGPGRPGWCE